MLKLVRAANFVDKRLLGRLGKYFLSTIWSLHLISSHLVSLVEKAWQKLSERFLPKMSDKGSKAIRKCKKNKRYFNDDFKLLSLPKGSYKHKIQKLSEPGKPSYHLLTAKIKLYYYLFYAKENSLGPRHS